MTHDAVTASFGEPAVSTGTPAVPATLPADSPRTQAARSTLTGAAPETLRIGELLVAKGVVSEDQVRIALTEQRRRHEPLGRILVRFGFATEGVVRDVLAGVLGYDSVDLSKVLIDGDVVKLVPREIARRYRVLALTCEAAPRRLTVATTDPFNVIAMDQVRALFDPGMEVRAVLAGEVEIDKAIDRFYGYELSVDGILNEIETGEIDQRNLPAESDEYSQPVVRLVNALLSDAVKRGASDLHFEPAHEFLRIRYRIDGVLRQIRSLFVQRREFWPFGQNSCHLRLGQYSCQFLSARPELSVFEDMSVFLPLSPALVMGFRRFPVAVVSQRRWRSGSLRLSSHPAGRRRGRIPRSVPLEKPEAKAPGQSRDAWGMMPSCAAGRLWTWGSLFVGLELFVPSTLSWRDSCVGMQGSPSCRPSWRPCARAERPVLAGPSPSSASCGRLARRRCWSCSRSRYRRRCAAPARLLVDRGLHPSRPAPTSSFPRGDTVALPFVVSTGAFPYGMLAATVA